MRRDRQAPQQVAKHHGMHRNNVEMVTNIFLWAAIAFVAGITGREFISTNSPCFSGWMLVASLGLAILLANKFFSHRTTYLLILPFFFLIGFLRAEPLQEPRDSRHIHNLVSHRQEATVIGFLAEAPQIGELKSRLLMDIEKLVLPTGTSDAKGKILLTIAAPPPPDLVPGDRFMAKVTVDRVRSFSNPGTFDYKAFMMEKDIWITGWARDSGHIHKILELPAHTTPGKLHYFTEKIRYRIISFLDQNLDTKTAGLYRAILTGDKAGLDPSLLENFRASGAVHLLSISGMHMGLLAFFFAGALAWLMKRSIWLLHHLQVWKVAAVLAVLPLTAYALLAGFHTPVVRALLMTMVFILAILSNRQWTIINNIAFAALVILAWKPSSLFHVSFQLSFAAVISIGLMYPKVQNLIKVPEDTIQKGKISQKTKALLTSCMAMSIAASLGTFPLLLYHFNRISILSPFSTLLITPFLCFWTLILGLVSLLFLPISPFVALKILQAGSLGIVISDKLSAFLAEIPLGSFWLPTPNVFEIAAFYMLLVVVLVSSRNRTTPILAMAVLGGLVLSPVYTVISKRTNHSTVITFLDVGQGNASVVELPGGRTILIDGGGPRTPHFNIGERIIAPFLWKRRITNISDVIINHPHSDHYNGLSFILSRFRPQRLWTNGIPCHDPEYEKLLNVAGSIGAQIQVPKAGEVIAEAEDSRLVALAGLHLNGKYNESGRDPNNMSLIMKLEAGPYSFLLPGDIDSRTEVELIASGLPLGADVLLAPHHGSGTSSSGSFLESISPAYVVISAGSYRPKIFPAPGLIENLTLSGVQVYSTAENGAVSFQTSEEELIPKPFRMGNNLL